MQRYIGSFVTTPAGLFISTGESKCKFLGHAAFTTVTDTIGTPGPSATVGDCILLNGAGPGGFDGYGISKKGFFTFTVGPLEQCFLAKDGTTPVNAGTAFCAGIASNIWFSTVTGPFTIETGLIKGGTVVGGSGMLTTAVNHCAMDAAPGGDSAVTTMTGTIDFA